MKHFPSRLAILGGAVLAATAIVVSPALPAEAATSAYGVNYMEFDTTPQFCMPDGGALPPGYGGAVDCPAFGGPSNTIYVQQVEVGGQWTFETLTGTGSTADDVWIPATFSAQCAGLRTLVAARVATSAGSGGISAFEVTSWNEHLPVNTDNRTIPGRNLDLDVPIDVIQDWRTQVLYPVEGAESIQSAGDLWVAEQVAEGVPELEARHQSHSDVIYVGFAGEVLCSGTLGNRGAADAEMTPIEIVYLGIGEEPGPGWRDAAVEPTAPGRDAQVDGQLTAAPAVTQATLNVLSDPTDSCRLLLSGTIATNEPMTVDYRFVDELGVPSQIFSVDVDLTQVAFLDHYVDLPVQAPTLEGGNGGAHNLSPTPGGGLDLVMEDTDREQGWYELQVIAPHSLTSEIASYNVAPCTSPTDVAMVETRG